METFNKEKSLIFVGCMVKNIIVVKTDIPYNWNPNYLKQFKIDSNTNSIYIYENQLLAMGYNPIIVGLDESVEFLGNLVVLKLSTLDRNAYYAELITSFGYQYIIVDNRTEIEVIN